MKIISTFNPFAKNPCSNRASIREFKDLKKKSQIAVIAATSFAALGTLFLFGLGGVGTFRLLTHKFSPKKTTPSKTTVAENPKTRASKPNAPAGIPNYGQSCYFTSPMQALLASKSFEEIAKTPLKQIEKIWEVKRIRKNVNGRVPRQETDQEFEGRKEAQKALIDLIDAKRKEDPKALSNALKSFHEKLHLVFPSQNFLSPIGKSGDVPAVIFALSSLLMNPEFQLCENSLFLNGKERDPIKAPKVLIVFNQELPEIDLDASHSYKGYVDGTYQVTGFAEYTGGHYIAHVRFKGDWFTCDDSRVRRFDSSQCYDLKTSGMMVLERL